MPAGPSMQMVGSVMLFTFKIMRTIVTAASRVCYSVLHFINTRLLCICLIVKIIAMFNNTLCHKELELYGTLYIINANVRCAVHIITIILIS